MNIRDKIHGTRERFDAQKSRVVEQITHRSTDIAAQGRKLREELDRRRDVTVGKLREESLERLYDVGEQALRTAANMVSRAEQLTPKRLNLLGGSAEKLLERAARIEHAKDELHKPAVEQYDNLNVAEVNQALVSLTPYQLLKLRTYEANHKNRVTILREIDRIMGEASN